MSLMIYKVKRYSRRYRDGNSRDKLKDQNIYEDVRYVSKRLGGSYVYDVFVAEPFVNTNDGLELMWRQLSPEEVAKLRRLD